MAEFIVRDAIQLVIWVLKKDNVEKVEMCCVNLASMILELYMLAL